MQSVSVSRLKASLSEYLARVKAGEEVMVTERSKPIAKLVPIPPAVGTMEHARELERRGILKIHGTGRIPPEFFRQPMPEDPEGLVLKYLLEEREEGW